MDILIAGFGVVGQGVAEVLASKGLQLASKFGERPRIVGVFDSTTAARDPEGLDPLSLLSRKRETGGVGEPHQGNTVDLVEEMDFDVLIELTPTDILSAEPAFSHLRATLGAGRDAITCNKGPLALRYGELVDMAESSGARLRFEGAVGGAMPVINLARETLRGEEILSLRGILNGTCNFILNRMGEEGLPLSQALREAQQLGIAEADPTYDIDGVDSACKLAILANALMGREVTLSDVNTVGIRGINEDAVSLAAEHRKVIRLVGEISDRRMEVSPVMVPTGHPLSIGGTLNMVQLKTDIAGEITVAGKGAGKMETSSAVLSDLVALLKDRHQY
ncbi:MAG: homoserine dehydrogenase [Methanomassiliicoccales archaeon]